MDDLIGKYFQVLDKGFVSLIDVMGDDSSIAQAARTSFGKGTKKVSNDRDLIRHLMRFHHDTPFEMCELKFFVRVPMDCWRQWIRHRTASVSEYSTRYSEAIDFCLQTNSDKWRLQSSNNKQGSDGYILDEIGKFLSEQETELHQNVRTIYKQRLSMGIAREQARKDLPLSTYTQAYWKIDLRNLLHFLHLRLDKHAQWEIRQYAQIIAGIVKELFPLTFEAFCDYVLYARTFSRQELQTLLISSDDKNYDGMSKSEIIEFNEKIKPIEQQDSFELDYDNTRDASYYEQNFLVGANND